MAIELAERGEPAPSGPPASPGAPDGAAAGTVTGQDRATILWVDEQPRRQRPRAGQLRDDGLEVRAGPAPRPRPWTSCPCAAASGHHPPTWAASADGEFRSHAGLALLRQLREAEQDQPVLVSTTSATGIDLDREDASDAGATTVHRLARPSCSPPSAPSSSPPRPTARAPGPTRPPGSGQRRPAPPIGPG